MKNFKNYCIYFKDDDLRRRVVEKGYKIMRYPLDIGRYYMAKHSKEKPNPDRFRLLKTSESRLDQDGVNNLKYEVVSFNKNLLYTKVIVNYDENTILDEFNQTNSTINENETRNKKVTLTSKSPLSFTTNFDK